MTDLKRLPKLASFLTLACLLVFVFSGCKMIDDLKKIFNPEKKTEEPVKETTTEENRAEEEAKTVYEARFASFKETPVTVTPKVKPYTVSKDLAAVFNRDKFDKSAAAKNLLSGNAFVVTPGEMKEFFQLYEDNRYSNLGNFITTDALLHHYHLLFNFVLRNLEKEKLSPEIGRLSQNMVKLAEKKFNEQKNTDFANAAKRNLAFFTVAAKISGAEVNVNPEIKDVVDQELALIEKHAGITVSPLMNLGGSVEPTAAFKEDYSQYIPRGHYAKTEELQKYFKTMMWYGRMTFRLKNDDEIKSVLLITALLKSSDEVFKSFEKIYEPINFFVGKSDDLSYYDFEKIMNQVYGVQIESSDLNSVEKFKTFAKETKKLPAPAVNSVPVFSAEQNPDREMEIKGFRFMGQRFTIDASIMQRLVDREVKERMLPLALDIPSAMGSKEAARIIKDLGVPSQYPDYEPQMTKVQKYLAETKEDLWTQNLYFGWLFTLKPLLDQKTDGYPAFMKNQAWQRKELNTFLGSYTELKHDTILYAKQVYAEMGGLDEAAPPKGYVEPNVPLYNRLAALLTMTKDGLEKRGLLKESDGQLIKEMGELCAKLKIISEKELEEKPLTSDEYQLLNTFGGDLEHFWIEAFKDEGVTDRYQANEKPAALVADIATDPNGRVLEEGIGSVNELWVVVPIEGKLHLVKGGVFSHYEFLKPLAERMTDEAWQKDVAAKNLPPYAKWTEDFLAAE